MGSGTVVFLIIAVGATLATSVDALRFTEDEYTAAFGQTSLRLYFVAAPLFLLCCLAGLGAPLVYFLWARNRLISLRAGHAITESHQTGQPMLSDDAQWLHAGHDRFEKLVEKHYGTPETILRGGTEALRRNDVAASLFFFQKSIDLLHTHYDFMGMRDRVPSEADRPIIDGYLARLGDVREVRPKAPIADSVREVTHRLRTIATACRRANINPSLYLSALEKMSTIAADVNVSDIFWQNPTLGDLAGGSSDPDDADR